MTIDPGAKQGLKPWTTFTQQQDIPDWIAKAYIESYRGPHSEEPGAAATGPIDLTVPAAIVTPAMLSAHYRLGQSRPAGESRVAVYPADDPAGFGPALQVVTDHGGMLMDSVTVLLHRLGVGYAAIMTPVFEVHRSPTGELLSVEPKPAGASAILWRGVDTRSARRPPSIARASRRSNGCCPRSWPTFNRSPATQQG